MSKHRTIFGLVALVILAAAILTTRSSSNDDAMASTAPSAFNARTNDNSGDEEQPVRSKKPVRYEATIANWKRYRSETLER
jgi:hypothetical protein